MPEADDRRWRMLALLATAELLGMAPWFAATAVAPEFRELWGLTGGESAWLTSIVQLGFVVGTLVAAILNLADILPSRSYFATCALLAGAVNAGLLVAGDFRTALVLRFLTGFLLAGVYPPAMKMAATWFLSNRGVAIGTIVGALTVGKALPYLVDALGGVRIAPVVAATSLSVMLAGVLVGIGYRDGPHAFARRPFSWRLAGEVARNREVRLVTAGYLGHMWELYAFWAWIAAFLAASVAAGTGAPGPRGVALAAFSVVAAGGIACVVGGRIADQIGRERLVMVALAASGTAALSVGLVFGLSFWIVVPLVMFWGMAVIADSAQFSALVTELAPAHAVGTALTLQTSLGFLLTTVTIQLVPVVVSAIGWRWAFAMLAVGPFVGIFAIARLRRLRRLQALSPRG